MNFRITPVQVLIFISLLFTIGFSIIGLHGYSLSRWHEHIDGTHYTETIIGQPRAIRSDDWVVQLPVSLSQRVSPTPFSDKNPLYGDGTQDFRLMHSVPIKSWIGVFRPESWGYFLGDDFGIAFQWWFGVFALLLSSFSTYYLISQRNFKIALGLGIATVYSPFLQFWSLNSAPLLVGFFLMASSGILFVFEKKPLRLFFYTLVFCWASLYFALNLYIPYQIPLAYLLTFLFIGVLFESKNYSLLFSLKDRLKPFLLLLSIALISFGIYTFFTDCKDSIRAMQNTDYPGVRSLSGGNYSLLEIFSNWALPQLYRPWNQTTPPQPSNICEGSLFYFFFPAVLFVFFLTKRKVNTIILSLFAYIGIVFFWIWIGFPPFLAKLSGWDKVPETRAMIGLGIADFLLLAHFLVNWLPQTPSHQNRHSPQFVLTPRDRKYLWIFFLIFLGSIAIYLLAPHHRPFMVLRSVIALCLALCVVGSFIYQKRFFLIFFAVFSILSTGWFNPWVLGGCRYLKENIISKKILELNNEVKTKTDKPSSWVYFGGGPISNLFRIVGVHSISGTYFSPPLGIWKLLDPEKRYSFFYNRYGNVSFDPLPRGSKHRFRLLNFDMYNLQIDPSSKEFEILNVDFIMMRGFDPELFEKAPNLRFEAKVYEYYFYRVLKLSQ